MTVREMMTQLDRLIASDPTVADLPVDADGCDCIEPAVEARERKDHNRSRRMLIARTA